jgi:hypothetical protein
MNRDVPPNYEDLRYVVTLVGEGGRREDLHKGLTDINLIKRQDQKPVDRTLGLFLYAGSELNGFIASETDEKVEIDIYDPFKHPFRTNTASFARTLGQLTTVMLQTGYQVKATKLIMPPKKNKKPEGFRDF